MWCPICGKSYPMLDTSDNYCPECFDDFKNKRWKFKLPKELAGGEPKSFHDYTELGKVFNDLRTGHITPEEYEEKMSKKAEELNRRNVAYETYQKDLRKGKEHAENLLLH